ncbi:hypothetical protein BDN70DRAFT_858972, partial [Pholiota conissans]
MTHVTLLLQITGGFWLDKLGAQYDGLGYLVSTITRLWDAFGTKFVKRSRVPMLPTVSHSPPIRNNSKFFSTGHRSQLEVSIIRASMG